MEEGVVGMVSLHAGHLLRENHRHKGVEDSLRLGYPQPGMVPANFGQERMGRCKARVVILLPAQCGGSPRGPRRARSPRLDLDRAVRMLQMDGGGAFGGERRAPPLAVSHPEPCALTDRREGQPEIQSIVWDETPATTTVIGGSAAEYLIALLIKFLTTIWNRSASTSALIGTLGRSTSS